MRSLLKQTVEFVFWIACMFFFDWLEVKILGSSSTIGMAIGAIFGVYVIVTVERRKFSN